MEAEIYVKAFLSLLFVAALIVVGFGLYKKFVLEGENPFTKDKPKKTLELVETLYLDQKRKLVVVKHKDKEILVLLGANSETVIKTAAKKKK